MKGDSNNENLQLVIRQRIMKIKHKRWVIPDIPAFKHADIVSTDCEFIPSVPTILDIAGKKVCKI